MADVACFCNCFYSFEGGAGACPRCGAVAVVMTAAAPTGRERSQRAQSRVPAVGDDTAEARARERAAGRRDPAVLSIPGLHNASVIGSVNEAQRAMTLTALSSGLAGRYGPGSAAGHRS